ncbi:MAG: hypothetical protein K9W42_08040 [Candidatus Heimdallarchaeota archaeon]|nr:hypothetical protein [Candidatus Heimdallarchaeota archaeon]
MSTKNKVLLVFCVSLLLESSLGIVFSKAEPIVLQFSIPAQSWKFVEIANLTSNQLLDFEWRTEIIVQGRQVTKEQFLTLQNADFSERAQYFESIGFFEGIHDYGRTSTDVNGKLWFVFYNPQSQGTTLTITLTLRKDLLLPWQIGLIATIVTVVILGVILFITYKLRQKMLEEQLAREKSPAERYFEM